MQEGVQVGEVEVRCALGLGEGKVEEEEGLDGVVERDPRDQPFGDVLDANQASEDGPVHEPSLELMLRRWPLAQDLVGCISGIEKGAGGADDTSSEVEEHSGYLNRLDVDRLGCHYAIENEKGVERR